MDAAGTIEAKAVFRTWFAAEGTACAKIRVAANHKEVVHDVSKLMDCRLVDGDSGIAA